MFSAVHITSKQDVKSEVPVCFYLERKSAILHFRHCLVTLTSGGDGRGSQAHVHGHLGSHSQQVVLESLLHKALLLFCEACHLPLGALHSTTSLKLFSQLFKCGRSCQARNLLLPQRQRHGRSCCHDRRSQVLWKIYIYITTYHSGNLPPKL